MTHDNHRQTSNSVARNVVYGSVAWLLPLGLSFVATPVIVNSLGNKDYGIYALILGFISYSFTFNFGRAITKYIAEYHANGEREKIRDVISASFFINVAVGLFGVALMCVLADWLVRVVFGIDAQDQEKTINAIYIASGVIFLWMMNQMFTSVLQGIQRFDVYSRILTASNFVLISGNLVLAYFGFGLLALLSWNLVVLGVFFTVFGLAAKKLLPEFGISFDFSREALRLVVRYSSAIVAYQVLANILLLFERGWITQRLGSESLTYYVVPMSLGIFLHGFVSSLVQVIFPLASELKNEPEKLLKLYTKATKVISLIVVFVVTSMIVESKMFLHLWMGESFAERSSSLLVVHIICFGLVSIMSIAWQMTEGLGFPKYNALVTGICTGIGISLMILLTSDLGNFGVAVARLTGFASTFFFIFFAEKRFFGKVQTSFWLSLAGSLTLAGVTAALAEYAITSIMPIGWPTLLLAIILGGAVYCFVLWIVGYVTTDDKQLIKGILRRAET